MGYEEGNESVVPRRSWLRSSWITLILVVWLVYELTAQPALGIAACCLKLGHNDFKTALWLYRADPEPGRGRACFCLFLGSGLWRVAKFASLLMFVSIFVLAFMDPIFRGQGAQGWANLEAQVTTIGVVMLLGFVLSSIITLLAAAFAWVSKSRLWIEESVHQARLENLWPPPDFGRSPGENKAERLVLFSFLMVVIPFWFILAAILSVGAEVAGFQDLSAILAVSFSWLGMILIPVSCWAIRNLFERRIIASLPSACWNSTYLQD